MSPLVHETTIVLIVTGCGWSQTLNTPSGETKPNPDQVDCRLLTA